MRDMSLARQLAGPTVTITNVTSRRLSLAVGPFLIAYVTEGGWAGVFRYMAAGR